MNFIVTLTRYFKKSYILKLISLVESLSLKRNRIDIRILSFLNYFIVFTLVLFIEPFLQFLNSMYIFPVTLVFLFDFLF